MRTRAAVTSIFASVGVLAIGWQIGAATVAAQTAALTHEHTVIQLEGSRLAATVNLVKSLGGGWSGQAAPAVKQ